MNGADWMVLYAAVGVAAALAGYRRRPQPLGRALGSGLVMLVLWPLWAPFVLIHARTSDGSRPESHPSSQPDGGGEQGGTGASAPPPDRGEGAPATARIERTLHEALRAAEQANLAELLSESDVRDILTVVRRASARLATLEQELRRIDATPSTAPSCLCTGTSSATGARTLAAVARRERSVERLRRMQADDAAALDEMAELCELLRAELLLARFGRAEDLAELKGELWSRLDGLAAVSSLDA